MACQKKRVVVLSIQAFDESNGHYFNHRIETEGRSVREAYQRALRDAKAVLGDSRFKAKFPRRGGTR